jgi:ATP-dependent DNA ligase
MDLPISTPFPPMEAKLAGRIPSGAEWEYEPKWDGFRCLAFRSGKEIELQSKAGQSLTRYFPEIVAALLAIPAKKFVLDGELIVTADGRLSFDDLLQRIHPAQSRVRKLAETTPARFIVFDLLVDQKGASWIERPFEDRREALEEFCRVYFADDPTVHLSTRSRDANTAEAWLRRTRGQLDGVVAKRIDQPYLSGERAMIKVKTMRSADCVVGGFRYGSKTKAVGSLLLGLYEGGLLQHVGFTSSIAAADRADLTKKLESLIEPPGFDGCAPGGPSRWSTERSGEWQPLRPKLVAEVQYDYFSGGRFRHGTKFLRWRPDKDPRQCLMRQVKFESTVRPADLYV